MTAWLVSLRLRGRRILLCLISGLHQLPHVQHRRGGWVVLQGNDMESEERVLLVRNNPCAHFTLYIFPRAAASTLSLVWMFVWM